MSLEAFKKEKTGTEAWPQLAAHLDKLVRMVEGHQEHH